MPKKASKSSIQYSPGDLIFAKVKGYPHWPARIDDLPEGAVKPPSKKYPIFFFGTHETAFLSANEIYPYEEYKHKYGHPRPRPFYNDGLWEVENDPTAKFRGSGSKLEEQRLAAMSPPKGSDNEVSDEEPQTKKQYKRSTEPLDSGGSEEEDDGSDEESSSSSESSEDEYFTVKKGKKATKPKKKYSSDSDSSSSSVEDQPPPSKKAKQTKRAKPTEKKPRKPREKKTKPPPKKYESSDISSSSSSESEEDVVSSWKKKDAERKKKQELEQARRLEEEARKMREIEKVVDKQHKELVLAEKAEKKKKSEKPKPTKRKEKEVKVSRKEKKRVKESPLIKKKTSSDKPRKRSESKETPKVSKQPAPPAKRDIHTPPKASDSEIAGHAAVQADLQLQLEFYEKQLKTALTVENPDIHKALQTLDNIDKIPVTANLLKKCQSLVATVKKIRRYKASQKVMDKSEKVYHRFKIVCTNLENGASLTASVSKGGFKERDSISPIKENS